MARKSDRTIVAVVLAMTTEGHALVVGDGAPHNQALTASPPTEPNAVTMSRASPAVRAASGRGYEGNRAGERVRIGSESTAMIQAVGQADEHELPPREAGERGRDRAGADLVEQHSEERDATDQQRGPERFHPLPPIHAAPSRCTASARRPRRAVWVMSLARVTRVAGEPAAATDRVVARLRRALPPAWPRSPPSPASTWIERPAPLSSSRGTPNLDAVMGAVARSSARPPAWSP